MTPLRMLSRVLLPLPLAPMSPMLRPASICQETSCRTGTPAKVLTRFSARISVMGSSLIHASCTRQEYPIKDNERARGVGHLAAVWCPVRPFGIAPVALRAYNFTYILWIYRAL